MAGGCLRQPPASSDKEIFMNKPISRRDFLKLAGGAVVTVTGASLLPQFLRKTLLPDQVVAGALEPYDLFFGGTDGWFSLPTGDSVNTEYHPDPLAADAGPFT